MDLNEHRKYIHDMANSLSIVEASVARVLTLMKRNYPESTDEIHRLEKASEYSKKTIDSLKKFREHIHQELNKETRP
jgi:hypothetical protein